MFAIKLADDGRVEYATFPEYATEDCIIVDNLPEDDISNYRYENGQFVYDNQEPQQPAPISLTLEERISALEKAAPAPGEYVAGTWYYRGDRVSFNGSVYICIAPAGVVCVWSPAEYAVYWKEVGV